MPIFNVTLETSTSSLPRERVRVILHLFRTFRDASSIVVEIGTNCAVRRQLTRTAPSALVRATLIASVIKTRQETNEEVVDSIFRRIAFTCLW